MYQRGLNKSSSSPNIATLDKYNYSFYHQNNNQIPQYNFDFNQNQLYFQNQINNSNLGYSFNNINPIKNIQNIGVTQYNNNNSQLYLIHQEVKTRISVKHINFKIMAIH